MKSSIGIREDEFPVRIKDSDGNLKSLISVRELIFFIPPILSQLILLPSLSPPTNLYFFSHFSNNTSLSRLMEWNCMGDVT